MKNGIWKRIFIIVSAIILMPSCSPPNFEDSLKKVEEYIGVGQYAKAVGIYEDIVEDTTDQQKKAIVFLRLGDLYFTSMGEKVKGVEAYKNCIEVMPLSEAARLAHERLAGIFEAEGLTSKVVEEYATLLKYFPNLNYRMRLGEAYIAAKEYQQARIEMRWFVEGEDIPKDVRWRALFNIGESYFLEAEPEKAVRFYHALIKEAPGSQIVREAEFRIIACLEEMGYLGMAHDFAVELKKTYPNPKVIEKHLEAIEKRGKGSEIKKKK